MDTKVAKIDDTLEVTTIADPVVTITRHDYGFLKQQRETIQAQKDRDNAARDAELAEVDQLLGEADKLGVSAKLDPTTIISDGPPTDPAIKG